jgi:futalosine hydrolase
VAEPQRQDGQVRAGLRILIVTATDLEIAALLERLPSTSSLAPRTTTCRYRGHDVDFLTTGVGMVATAAWCARALAERPYDVAFNFGVCGSFDPQLPPPAVVHVVSDRLAELGAEDGDELLTIHDLQLLDENEFPFERGMLINRQPPDNVVLRELPEARGITVNTVHGQEASILAVARRFGPQVESMEGAAFMYACLVQGVRFAQVRAVSNVVERRNRAAWRLPEAVARVTDAALGILDRV